jgi:hypothetical protein
LTGGFKYELFKGRNNGSPGSSQKQWSEIPFGATEKRQAVEMEQKIKVMLPEDECLSYLDVESVYHK